MLNIHPRNLSNTELENFVSTDIEVELLSRIFTIEEELQEFKRAAEQDCTFEYSCKYLKRIIKQASDLLEKCDNTTKDFCQALEMLQESLDQV